jgi:hypothetical protein
MVPIVPPLRSSVDRAVPIVPDVPPLRSVAMVRQCHHNLHSLARLTDRMYRLAFAVLSILANGNDLSTSEIAKAIRACRHQQYSGRFEACPGGAL